MSFVYGPILLLAFSGTIAGSTGNAEFKLFSRFSGTIIKTFHFIAINAFLVAVFATRVPLEQAVLVIVGFAQILFGRFGKARSARRLHHFVKIRLQWFVLRGDEGRVRVHSTLVKLHGRRPRYLGILLQDDVVLDLDQALGVGLHFQNFFAENPVPDQLATRVSTSLKHGDYVVKVTTWGENTGIMNS